MKEKVLITGIGLVFCDVSLHIIDFRRKDARSHFNLNKSILR